MGQWNPQVRYRSRTAGKRSAAPVSLRISRPRPAAFTPLYHKALVNSKRLTQYVEPPVDAILDDVAMGAIRMARPYEPGRFKRMRLLGKGTYGEVSLVKDNAIPGRQLVLKRMDKNEPGILNIVLRELVALRMIRPVCARRAICYDGFFQDEKSYYLTTHYHAPSKGKRIMSLLQAMNAAKPMSQERKSAIARNLVQTVRAIHDLGLAHRDVKPENVLVESGGTNRTDEANVRLIDFGATCWAGDCESDFNLGTEAYSPPELVLSGYKNGSPDARLSLEAYQKADIYALGLTLLVLWKGGNAADDDFEELGLTHFHRNWDFNKPPKALATIYKQTTTQLLQHGGPDLRNLLQRNPHRRHL
jgi:serine/threonine protein kinase